jgi:hypothetical protein
VVLVDLASLSEATVRSRNTRVLVEANAFDKILFRHWYASILAPYVAVAIVAIVASDEGLSPFAWSRISPLNQPVFNAIGIGMVMMAATYVKWRSQLGSFLDRLFESADIARADAHEARDNFLA